MGLVFVCLDSHARRVCGWVSVCVFADVTCGFQRGEFGVHTV